MLYFAVKNTVSFVHNKAYSNILLVFELLKMAVVSVFSEGIKYNRISAICRQFWSFYGVFTLHTLSASKKGSKSDYFDTFTF